MFDEPKGAWEILPAWRAAVTDRRYDMLDRSSLEAFLRRFVFDYRVMSNMRQILTSTDPVSRFTDDEVVDAIAWKLATKELVIRQPGKYDVAPPSDGGGGDDKKKKKADVKPDNIKPAPPPPPPGNLQVTVLDDKGRGVANVAVNGPSVKKTDATGKALWQGLAPGSYQVTVNTPLPDPPNKDLYLPAPEVPAKTAVVPSGGTAALIFRLKRKPSPTIAVAAPKILLVKQEYDGKDKPPLMQPIVPHRISVKLGLIEDYDGVGELTIAPADVRVFEKQDDKTEKALPWQIPAADLKPGKTVWMEGKNPSASLEGTVAKLSLKNGTIPPKVVDATDKFTCVLLQLDIFHARGEDKSEPFAVPRILRIDTGGLTVVHDPSKHLFGTRLKLVVSRAKPADYKGKLVVKPVNASVQAFDKEVQAAADKPLTGDQLKFVNTSIDAAKGKILWNQGVTQSTDPIDTGWTVETEDVPGKEGDRIMLTVLNIALLKIETTDITDSSKWEADDDFSPTLTEKAKVFVQVKPVIKVNNVQLRIDFGRLNNKPKGADPLVNGSFTLVSRAEQAYPANKDHFEYTWNGKSTVAAAQEFSNRTTPNVSGGNPNIPLPAIASGANIPHGLYFIDQICLLQSNGIIGRLRPEDIDLSVPILANLTYNGNWAADLAAFGLTPFQSDIEKALLRFGGRDYMIRDAGLANRINVRFIANTGISNALSIRSSIGGPDPANNGLFGSTPDGPAPLSDNLYTFNEGLSSDITIFPSTFLDFNNTAVVADQTTFRGIFAPLGVAPAQNTGAPGTATARAVDAAGKVTGGTTAADDQANVTVVLDQDGMATVTSTNPAKVPAARASEIQAALRAFVHFTGNTINHETAHGLGVASRVKANNKITIAGTTVTSPLDGDAGAHNKVTNNTNIVDAGSTRSFPRRIEAAGLPQQKFSATNTRYLRDCIPFDLHDN